MTATLISPLVLSPAKRAGAVTWAFLRMGARATFSYPLSFVLLQLGAVFQLVGFLFLAHLTRNSASLGSGYLAFAAVGLAATQVTSGGILGLGQELEWAIEQGRLEMLLIEPISWRLIPVALAAWPTLYRLVNGVVILVVAWGFGAAIGLHDVPTVIALVVLGVGSSLVIGLAAGALRVLAKRGDPLAVVYGMAAGIFSGVFVPINVFPLPLRVIAWFFPSTYLIAGMRKTLMADSSQIYGPSPAQAVLLLLAVCVILLPLSMWIFGRSLETGRKYGVLAGY
jgi:ABC-2 type transport system permease protein